METTLYQIKFYDGRIFRVFCYGKNQKKRLNEKVLTLEHVESVIELSNGIHTIAEFEMLKE